MSSQQHSNLLDASLDVGRLPANGGEFNVVATPDQLTRIAKIALVSSLERLSAKFSAKPVDGGAKISGSLFAELTQPCVVTLVPVTQKIQENLNRVFLTGEEHVQAAKAGSEIFVDLQDDDMPDYFSGPDLDLSHYLLEVLGLAIDLYPKAQGAELSTEQKGELSRDLSPFSVLRALAGTK